MTNDSIRAVASLHTATAWSATATLLGAAILRAASRGRSVWVARASIAAALGTVLLTATFALGFLLDAPYSRELRQRLFIRSPTLGWLFERKEHFAVATVLFAWCGAAALALRTRRARSDDRAAGHCNRARNELDVALDAIVIRGYAAALFCAALAAALSAVVARAVHF